MNIILCGLPKSGKSSIGKLLANELDRNFIDTDRLVEEAYAKRTGSNYSCRQIFQVETEEYFRALEKDQLYLIQTCNDSVISVGGGTLNDPSSVLLLRSLGMIVYLQASLDTVWKRIEGHTIPAFLDQTEPKEAFMKMAENRIPIYENSAHVIIPTDHSNMDDLVTTIIHHKRIQNGN